MRKTLLFFVFSMSLFNMGFATIYYKVQHTLPQTDEFYQIENEILNRGTIKIDEVRATLLAIKKEQAATREEIYAALRTAYKYIVDYNLSIDGVSTKEQIEELHIFMNALQGVAEMAMLQHSETPQIAELLGDFFYFGNLMNSGSNMALFWHHKAYNAGLKSDSVKLKIMLDLVNMYLGYERIVGQGGNVDITNRASFLFSSNGKSVNAEDAQRWLQLSMYFYSQAENKDTLVSLFFKWWFDKNKDFKEDLVVLKEGLAILDEYMANENVKLKKRVEEYQIRVKNSENSAAIREATTKKMEERKKEFESVLAELSILEELPNTMIKLEPLFRKLENYRKEVSEYKALPNYERLKSVFPQDSEEADILNCFFLYIKKDYNKILEMSENFSAKDKDTRIYFLRFICLRKTKASLSAIEECINEWLKIDPESIYARQAKIVLDRSKENSTK